jgi:hypothetical protein
MIETGFHLFGVFNHGPELKEPEPPAVQAAPFLFEEHRAPRGELYAREIKRITGDVTSKTKEEKTRSKPLFLTGITSIQDLS